MPSDVKELIRTLGIDLIDSAGTVYFDWWDLYWKEVDPLQSNLRITYLVGSA